VRNDELTPLQKTVRSLGMTVLLVTALFLAGLAYTYVSGDEGSAWKRVALATALAAGSVATFAMTADTVDLWVRGRRMTPFSVKMTRSLIFVAMLAALGLSLAAAGPALLLTMTPALMIYLFGVVRQREAPVRRPRSADGRQRRGGKRHK
jgi:O-antigen/teichoic acid export membrane protein